LAAESDISLSRNILRILLVLILVALTLGGLAYIAGPKITERLATTYLEDMGATNVLIELERPGLNGVFIAKLEIRWQDLDVKARSARVSYSIPELLAGQIDAIVVKQFAVIRLSENHSSSSDEGRYAKMEVPAALFMWPELLAEPLPARIKIDEFLYRDPDIELQGKLFFSDNSLQVRGAVQLPWLATDYSYELAIDRKHKVELILSQGNVQGEAQVSLQSSVTDKQESQPGSMQLHGELNVNAGLLLDIVKPYTQGIDIQSAAGKLSLELLLQAPWQEAGWIAFDDLQISASITPDLSTHFPVPDYEQFSAQVKWNESSAIKVSAKSINFSSGPNISVTGPDFETELSIGASHLILDNFVEFTGIEMTVLSGASLKLKNLSGDDNSAISVPGITLSTSSSINLTVDQKTQSLHVQAAVLDLHIPQVIYQKAPYSLHPLIINTPNFSYASNTISNLTVNIRNAENSFSIDTNVEMEQWIIRSNSQISLSSESSLINVLVSDWQNNFDATGSLLLNLTASLNTETLNLFDLYGELSIKNSNIFLDDIAIRGINLKAPFNLKNSQIFTDWIGIEIDQASLGVKLNEIKGRLRYSPSKLNIDAFKMKVLGGKAHNEPLDYTFGSSITRTKISFANLQLPRLVALADDEIHASGVIDGSVQLSILFEENGSPGIVIENGSLSARSPGGLIQYNIGGQSVELAKQSDFDFALTALENFNYRQLSSSIILTQTGELKLGVSLLGSNPQVKDGQMIQYNLNIDQNIFTLLRSLQLSNRLSDRIGEKFTK